MTQIFNLKVLRVSFLFILALALRLITLDRAIWIDEGISISHAIQSFGNLLISSSLRDMHPPVYFLQLKFWIMISDNEYWIRLNSVLWSLSSIGLLYYINKKRLGEKVAELSAFLLAIMPVSLFYAHEIRMYAFLSVLFLAAWHFNESYFSSQESKQVRHLTWILILGILIVFSHATGFVMVFFLGLFFIVCQWGKYREKKFLNWFKCYVLMGVVSSPIVYRIAFLNKSASSAMGNSSDIFTGISQLIFGIPNTSFGAGFIIVGLYLVGLMGCLKKQKLVWFFIFLVAGPILFSIGISAFVKPMYKARALYYTIPFLCTGVALGLEFISKVLKQQKFFIVVLGIVFLLFIPDYLRLKNNPGPVDLFGCSQFLKENVLPDETVLVQKRGVLRAIGFYLGGKNWFKPYELHDIENPEISKRKQELIDQLGESLARKLQIIGRTNEISVGGIHFFLGLGSLKDALAVSDTVWYVLYNKDNEYPPGIENLHMEKEVQLKRILIQKYKKHE